MDSLIHWDEQNANTETERRRDCSVPQAINPGAPKYQIQCLKVQMFHIRKLQSSQAFQKFI